MAKMSDELREALAEALAEAPAYLHLPFRWRWVDPDGIPLDWNPGNVSPLINLGVWGGWSIEAILFNGQKVSYKPRQSPSSPVVPPNP